MKLHERVKDGIYHISLFGDPLLYRAEKIQGIWYFTDGTGWKDRLLYPESIMAAKDISHLPNL